MRLLPLLVSGAVAAVSFAGAAPAQATPAGAHPAATPSATTTSTVPGLPASVPAAALRPEPTLPTPAATRTLQLGLTNVSKLTVDTARALLPHGTATATSDGPATLALSGLRPGTTVRVPGGQTVMAGKNGTAAVPLPAGTSTVSW